MGIVAMTVAAGPGQGREVGALVRAGRGLGRGYFGQYEAGKGDRC